MDIIERLACEEHSQWCQWARHMLDNMTPENIVLWRRQIDTPYLQLSEEDKEKDRVWARRTISHMIDGSF